MVFTKIGRHQIISELGEGGFGKVYLALDPTLNSRRAIKVLSAPQDPSLRIRFKNEAVAAASLNHPNIVTILEYGEEHDRPYIVMEYLEGKDLAKRIASPPPLTLFQKVNILHQVASGLDAAHSHPSKIIHRDVKPANVMILPDGTAKIMDFGIARLAGDTGTRLTSANVMIGSMTYMAPEQFISGVSDALSDIWSFGVLAYELLAEEHPFPGNDVTQVMYRITSVEPAPVESLLRGCPPELAAIVAKAMCKNRAQRYQTLEDAAFDLNVVRIDLRKSEAGQILQKAEDLYSSGQLENALKTVRDALEVDSQMRSARDLREKLQAEIQTRANRSRVDSGLRKVAEAMDRGDLSSAVRELEAVCLLDPNDSLLSARLQELRAALERREQVAKILEGGERSLHAQNVEEASEFLTRAVALDPTAPSIPIFRERISQVEASKKQQAEVQRIVHAAESEASAKRLRAAIRLIAEGLERYPKDPRLSDCSKHYADLERQEYSRLQNAQAAISDLFDRGDRDRARSLCAEAIRRYPDHAGLEALFKKIEGAESAAQAADPKQNAEARRREIDTALLEIRRALATLNLQEASRCAEEAVRRFPEEQELRGLLNQVRGAIAERESAAVELPAAAPVAEPIRKPIPKIEEPTRPAAHAPAPVASRTKPILWLGGAAAVLVGALALYFATRPSTPPPGGQGPSSLSVSPSFLDFSVGPGSTPETKRIEIRPPMNLTIQAPAWIRVDQTVAADSTQLAVQIRGDQLPAGPAEGSISMVTPAGTIQSVSVRATPSSAAGSVANKPPVVSPSPAEAWVRADSSELDFTTDRKSADVKIYSEGPPRAFRVAADADWIAINKASERTPAVLQISVRNDRLGSGAHSGTITIQPADTSLAATRIRVRAASAPIAAPITERIETPPVPQPVVSVPVPPVRVVPKLNQRWTGGLEGELRIRRTLRPGEVIDLTSTTPAIDGTSNFPWLYDTRVQLRVVSPPSVMIDTQPGRGNDWNLIRLRAGADPAQLVILDWQISP